MTGSKFFLDTNIIIEVFDGNKAIADNINKLENFYISSIVLGELYVGINRMTNKSMHLKKIVSLLDLCTVIDVDSITAEYFGEITAALYKKGRPVPSNDIWIAASSKQHELTLVTRDKHFSEIQGLDIISW